MKKIITFLILSSLMLIGCGENTTSTDIDLSKVLSLTYQQSLKKGSVECVEDSLEVDINLGCFYQSSNNYATLNNNTEYELTDVNIISSNPSFDVSPSYIASIGAPNKNTGVTPIVRFSVLHGSPLNNLGAESTMPRGANSSTITITGKVNGQDFKVEYVIGGTAKTMELEHRGDSCVLSGPMYVGGTTNTNQGTYVDNYEVVKPSGSDGSCSVIIIEEDRLTTLAVPHDIITFIKRERTVGFKL